jgi:hypothetical protein
MVHRKNGLLRKEREKRLPRRGNVQAVYPPLAARHKEREILRPIPDKITGFLNVNHNFPAIINRGKDHFILYL